MLSPIFSRRRLTWRRTLFLTSAFFLFWILVFTLTPITSPLPPYTGPHEVGILDFETQVQRRVVHGAVLKESGERAFELSTLAITLYYPTTPSTTPHPWARPWLPQPISLIGTGYARLANIYFPPLQAVFTLLLWLFGSSTVIPGVVDGPVLSGAERVLVDETSGAGGMGRIMKAAMLAHERQVVIRENEDSESSSSEGIRGGDSEMGKLPCVVFTHGMAGMSQSYSHYLGSIASHGYVVAAVEHRDGSGPGTIVHYPNGKEKKVWHMKLQDLEYDPPMTDLDLKAAQLAFREAEIEETISLFHTLHQGNTSTLTQLKPSSPSTAINHFKNRLDLSAITVAGHSYGATGALQAMRLGSPENSNSTPLINGGIVLDPGKGSGPLNKDIDVPIIVIQSGQWTEKQTDFYGQGKHFGVVRDLVRDMRQGWFMTLTGSAHPSCTDAPLIVPWIMKMVTGTTLDARVALREYVDVSVEFLEYLRDERRTGVLKSQVTSMEGPLGEDGERGKVKGRDGADWEVHVVPKEVEEE